MALRSLISLVAIVSTIGTVSAAKMLFKPNDKTELKQAIKQCIEKSPVGNCPNGAIGDWDVSAVTDMSGVFADKTHFNQDLSKWDVSAATNMANMFANAQAFNQDLSAWTVSKVYDMSAMFRDAYSFDRDLSKWDLSSVETMQNMFRDAKKFKQSLCGTHWRSAERTDNVNTNSMFHGSGGSITKQQCEAIEEPKDEPKDTTTTPTKQRSPSPSKTETTITITTATTISSPRDPSGFLILIVVGSVVVVIVAAVAIGICIKFCCSKNEQPTLPLRKPRCRTVTSSPVPSPLPPVTDEHTFANSRYKHYYGKTEAADFQYDLLGAVSKVLKLYIKRQNPKTSQDTIDAGVHSFMTAIQKDAFEHNEALLNDVDAVAEYLWTSSNTHKLVEGMELCSVLNAVIRDDIAHEIKAATIIFRCINNRRVTRSDTTANLSIQSYPPKGETWRGGGFRKEYKSFFDGMVGKKYRVPSFLATSQLRKIAAGFALKASCGYTRPSAMWRIVFDKRGEEDIQYRVKHMTFVSKTLIKGENEYLFAPYSVFTLVSVEWSKKKDKSHEFTILAACDNKVEDEDLPLAPWT